MQQVVGRYHKQLRDYSLLMEYKKLKALAPAGVYVLPSTENLREWHGVIFLRKSYYRNGVFKFVISIPESYPEEGPRVFFVSKVFNPMISPDSGELDLSAQFPIWNPNQHYIVLVLAYIKKIFYKYEYWLLPPSQMPFNPQALALWTKNKDAFMVECERCSQLSVNRATQNEEELCLRMTDPKPTHVEVLKRIMASSNEGGKGEEGKGGGEDPRFISWFLDGVRRLG